MVLPLANGMSTQATAQAIGRSPRWVTSARNEFVRNAGKLKKDIKKVRNRAHMTRDEEEVFLSPFLDQARSGGVLVVSVMHKALEQHLGRWAARWHWPRRITFCTVMVGASWLQTNAM